MFISCFQKALAAMKRYGLLLLGISVLSTVVCDVADNYDGGISILSIAFGLLIIAGVCKIFLDANDGKQIETETLFDGFSVKKLPKVLGGMAWGAFWAHIWLSIPKAIISGILWLFSKNGSGAALGEMLKVKITDAPKIGDYFKAWEYFFESAKYMDALAVTIISFILVILVGGAAYVFVAHKLYSYRFLPYILVTKDDIKATDALKLSKQMTNGKKLNLFIADIICVAPVALVVFLIGLLGDINGVTDKIFTVVNFIIKVAAWAIIPLFAGLYSAAFFTAKKAPRPQPQNFQNFQGFNGAPQNFQNFNNGAPQNFQNFNNGAPQNFQNFNNQQ